MSPPKRNHKSQPTFASFRLRSLFEPSQKASRAFKNDAGRYLKFRVFRPYPPLLPDPFGQNGHKTNIGRWPSYLIWKSLGRMEYMGFASSLTVMWENINIQSSYYLFYRCGYCTCTNNTKNNWKSSFLIENLQCKTKNWIDWRFLSALIKTVHLFADIAVHCSTCNSDLKIIGLWFELILICTNFTK